ncbi:MAG: ABC transporter substrate-binding protein [Xanthobacteraceae bacterium]
MRRRKFISFLGSAAAAWPLAAQAEQRDRVRRVAVLMGYAEGDILAKALLQAFVRGLVELGWSEGRNLAFDVAWAAGDAERMNAMARELVASAPDAILANTTPGTAALQRNTQSMPIVFAVVSDPVGDGLIANLSRPGGNTTGFINNEASMGGKWLEFLKEAAPRIRRAAYVFNPETAPGQGRYFWDAFEAAARVLNVQPLSWPVRSVDEFAGAAAKVLSDGTTGVVLTSDSFLLSHRSALIDITTRQRTPSISSSATTPQSGGLMSYGPDLRDIFHRAASYVDRVLRGASPADLPVQVPAKFELVINLKTAKVLGIEVPPTLLARADEVIE